MNEIKRLFQYALSYKWKFLLGIFLLILRVGLELIGPLIIMIILDEHIVSGAGNIDLNPIIQLLMIFALVKIIQAIISYFTSIILQFTGAQVVQDVRHELFSHIQRLPIKYFDNLPAGKVVARITNDTESMLQFFTFIVPTFLVNGVTMFFLVAAIFTVNMTTGIVMLIFIPIVVVWIIFYRNVSDKHNHIKRERNSDLNAIINESINGMTMIQVFNQEKQIESEFQMINDEFKDSSKTLIKIDGLFGFNLSNTLQSVVFATMILIFSILFLTPGEALTVGVMYLIVDYITRFFNPLFEIINQLQVLEQSRVAAVKVFEILDEEAEKEDIEVLEHFNGSIQFNNVSFSYDGNRNVLNNINIKVDKGETVALVGHTGSGKSSIINLLMRFYDPTQGEILFAGQDTQKINKQNLREHMSIVLQDPFIYAGSLLYNIRLNNTDISELSAKQALIDVGGSGLLNNFNDDMHTHIPERGANLSLGERQLISFARALAFNPKVLVLDEATSNVDSETEQLIQHAMKVVSAQRTTLVIAHRLSTIKDADQIIVLDSGEIKEHGNHQQLMTLGNIYKSMYDKQVVEI